MDRDPGLPKTTARAPSRAARPRASSRKARESSSFSSGPTTLSEGGKNQLAESTGTPASRKASAAASNSPSGIAAALAKPGSTKSSPLSLMSGPLRNGSVVEKSETPNCQEEMDEDMRRTLGPSEHESKPSEPESPFSFVP